MTKIVEVTKENWEELLKDFNGIEKSVENDQAIPLFQFLIDNDLIETLDNTTQTIAMMMLANGDVHQKESTFKAIEVTKENYKSFMDDFTSGKLEDRNVVILFKYLIDNDLFDSLNGAWKKTAELMESKGEDIHLNKEKKVVH